MGRSPRFLVGCQALHKDSGAVALVIAAEPATESRAPVYTVDFHGLAGLPAGLAAEPFGPDIWRARDVPEGALEKV